MSRRDPARVRCPRPSPLDELIAREDPHEADDCDDTRALMRRLDELMPRIPHIERVLVRLVMAGKTQQEMAEITGIRQSSVSGRIRRAVARLRYHARKPDVDVVVMARDMAAQGYSTDDIAIIAVYLETACLSEVSRRLGIRYHVVRAVLDKAPSRMSAHESLTEYLEALEYVRRWGLLGRTQ